MKLSLPRVTLLLQFLATLVADDDDVSSPQPLDITPPAAITDASSDLNGNPILHSLEILDNDSNIDAYKGIITQAQYIKLDDSVLDNADGTEKINIKTVAEDVHDDSLSSMPSMIPGEIMDMGSTQNDHADVIVSTDSADDQIEYTGTRTRTDTSEQMENVSVHMGDTDEMGEIKNRVDTRAETEQPIEVIPEISKIKVESSQNAGEIEINYETDKNIEIDTQLNPVEEKDDNEDERLSNEVVVDYANKSTGAIILDKSSNFKGTNNLLLGNNDRYAISPCEGESVKYVIIGLSEDIEVHTIKLSSYERYSSQTKKFEVLGSTTYPISTKWEKLGTFEAKPWFKENGEQTFELEHPSWCRYLKFRFITHYGVEHYCTVTEVKVHGSTTQQGFHMQWDARDEEKEEEDGEKQEEAVPNLVRADVASHGGDTSSEGHNVEVKERMGKSESTLANEDVTGENKPDIEASDRDTQNNHDVGSTEHIKELATGEDQTDVLSDTANDKNRKEISSKSELLADETKPHSATHLNTDIKDNIENKSANASIKNQTIRAEIIEKMDTSVIDNSVPRTTSIIPDSKKNGSEQSTLSSESENTRNIGSGQPTLRPAHKSIAPHSLEYVFSNYPHTSDLDTDFSALAFASIKTASSKFATEKARIETANVWVIDSQISVNQIKTKMSSGRNAIEEKSNINDLTPQGVSSKVSKVVKDAIDSMNIMKMKGAPSMSGLLEIINSKFIPEAFQDDEKFKSSHDESDAEITLTEEVPMEVKSQLVVVDADDSPSNHDTHFLPPDTVSETKSEPLMPRHDLLKSISDQACLKELDYQVFKAKFSKAGGTGSVSGNGAAGGSKNEPIFKKLTDEIKVLQTSQTIHDQYVKAVTTCYERVIVDFYKEISFLKVEQEERLLSMEEQLRNLGRKEEERSQRGDIIGSMMLSMMSYWQSFCALMCPYLEIARQWSISLLDVIIKYLCMIKMHVSENETFQEFLRITSFHMGEICAFFAGTMFCFLVVSLVWWAQSRKIRKNDIRSKSMDTNEIPEIKEPEERVDVIENGNEKRKKKKNRRIRKPSVQQLICTDFSESSHSSLQDNSSFG